MLKALLLAAVLALSAPVLAREAAPAAADPALEERATAIAVQLRCLVCQNQTIAESNAPLAVDLKNQIREQLGRGAGEGEILDFMVERYGDFVLYRPPFKASTVLLWLGPLLLAVAGIVLLYRRLAQRSASDEPRLSEAERQRARRLLAGNKENSP